MQSVHDNKIDPLFFFFCDEVSFHLHKHVSSLNNQYLSFENPHLMFEVPLHDIKVGVWCSGVVG
jgi:hypothetical protein